MTYKLSFQIGNVKIAIYDNWLKEKQRERDNLCCCKKTRFRRFYNMTPKRRCRRTNIQVMKKGEPGLRGLKISLTLALRPSLSNIVY